MFSPRVYSVLIQLLRSLHACSAINKYHSNMQGVPRTPIYPELPKFLN